jgi:dynein regulatry complex protein 1
MEERRTKEVAFLDERFKRVERNETELHNLRVRDAEEYNEMKVKLETDVQILEQQLQQMKATYQLNQEKLAYNYQVLQKRDEENAKTKAQQKRKITKLQDALTNLKKKLSTQIKKFNDENLQISEEYKRVTDMFNDLELKSKHFLSVDLKKFQDIWEMNESQCKELARNLLEADRIIHEQQLGLQWRMPDLSFMANVGPINGSQQVKSGKEFVNELFSADNENEYDEEEEEQEEQNREIESIQQELEAAELMRTQFNKENTIETLGSSLPDSKYDNTGKKSVKFPKETSQFREDSHNVILNLSKFTLRKIVMLICDEAGFLLEQKLVNLLLPLEKNEQSMVKLDSIFKALGIETENDVRLLAQYFVDHHKYKELIKNKSFTQQQKKGSQRLEVSDDENDDDNDDEDNKNQTVPLDSIKLIHPNEVLTALKTFVTLHHKSSK